jgi:hypothetical protein
MSIVDKINEIGEIINSKIAVPSILIEHIILIVLIVGLNRFIFDGPYMYKESLISLLFLYLFNWFVFRITGALFGWFDFFQILTPLKCMAILLTITVILSFIFPRYEFINHTDTVNGIRLSNEEMAAKCDDSKWIVSFDYEVNQAYLSQHNLPMQTSKGWEHFTVSGNTEQAKIMAQNMINIRLEYHPEFKYISHTIGLTYMPRKYCQENGYSLDFSEPKEY